MRLQGDSWHVVEQIIVSEENLGDNDVNIGFLDSQRNRLASEHLDYVVWSNFMVIWFWISEEPIPSHFSCFAED